MTSALRQRLYVQPCTSNVGSIDSDLRAEFSLIPGLRGYHRVITNLISRADDADRRAADYRFPLSCTPRNHARGVRADERLHRRPSRGGKVGQRHPQRSDRLVAGHGTTAQCGTCWRGRDGRSGARWWCWPRHARLRCARRVGAFPANLTAPVRPFPPWVGGIDGGTVGAATEKIGLFQWIR